MRNVVVTVAYDGTNYLGWQKTNLDTTQPSIEYLLQTTLEQIVQHPTPLQAASRTDRGVHAEDQVVNFFVENEALDLDRLQHSLNCLLPPDIRVLTIQDAPKTFHATVDTKKKQYLYRIYKGPVLLPALRFTHWHILLPLDLEKMHIAANILIGEHDFIAFRNMRKGIDYNDTVRTVIDIQIEEKGAVLEIKVTANNFLYKMCRNIIGTMVYVAAGKLSPGSVATLLQGGKRADAGITAPAHGLTLHKVYYASRCF